MRPRVAKNAPTIGRTVATASPRENARIIHSRCNATSPRRIQANARPRETRKRTPKSTAAALSVAPPIATCGHHERGHPITSPDVSADVTDPPMHSGSPGSKCRHELERPKHHEDQPGSMWSMVSGAYRVNTASKGADRARSEGVDVRPNRLSVRCMTAATLINTRTNVSSQSRRTSLACRRVGEPVRGITPGVAPRAGLPAWPSVRAGSRPPAPRRRIPRRRR